MCSLLGALVIEQVLCRALGRPTDAYKVPPGVEQEWGLAPLALLGPRWGSVKTGRLPGGVFFAELLKGIDLGSLVDNDVDLKIDDFNQNVLLMSPPASDSGSQAGFSPYSIDSEPGSPLLDEAKVEASEIPQPWLSPVFSKLTGGGCAVCRGPGLERNRNSVKSARPWRVKKEKLTLGGWKQPLLFPSTESVELVRWSPVNWSLLKGPIREE